MVIGTAVRKAVRVSTTIPTAPSPAIGWPVRDAAARVGVSVSTLRSWERRYGLRPTDRSRGGHRRYTAPDIAKLQRLQRLVDSGVPTAEAAAAVLDAPVPMPSPRSGRTRGGSDVDRLRAASDALDLAAATATARTMLRAHGAMTAWTEGFVPALQAAGSHWERTGNGVECEHVLADAVQIALTRYTLGHKHPLRPARVVLAATDGEAHVLPLHALAAALAERGIAGTVVGSLPSADLLAAADRLAPHAAVLWSRSKDTADATALARLDRRVPLTCAAGPGWSRRRRRSTRELGTTVELLDAWLRAPHAD